MSKPNPLHLWETHNHPCYWLVTQAVQRQAVQQDPRTSQKARTLFSNPSLRHLRTQSPELIPINPAIAALPDDILGQGIILSCPQPRNNLLMHLRSLLMAECEHQSVLFRYYDPHVLASMIPKLSSQRTQALLGPIHALCFTHHGALQHMNSETADTFTPNPNAQWRMEPSELGPSDPARHARYLVQRLWQVLPEVMSTLENPQEFFQNTLTQEPGTLDSQRERWAFAQLIQKTGVPSATLAQAQDAQGAFPQNHYHTIIGYQEDIKFKGLLSYTGQLRFIRRCKGDLSRLYLRTLYGLAEYYQVPVTELRIDGSSVWTSPPDNGDPDYYGLPENYQGVALNGVGKHLLNMAKQGDYQQIESTLGAMVKKLMDADLIHHSSDEGTVNKPNIETIKDKNNNNISLYRRTIYVCTRENNGCE